jgi:hypothetical protein
MHPFVLQNSLKRKQIMSAGSVFWLFLLPCFFRGEHSDSYNSFRSDVLEIEKPGFQVPFPPSSQGACMFGKKSVPATSFSLAIALSLSDWSRDERNVFRRDES